MLFHPDLLFAAAAEWEASDFRHMPTLEELSQRNLVWREQVVGVWRYLEWVRKAAEHPNLFGSIDDALKEGD